MPVFQNIRLSALQRAMLFMHCASLARKSIPAIPPHLEMGERGEEAALFALRREGYVIVARKWKNVKQRGDIDLIAWEGDTLCFIEVKTRGGHAVASAESAVDEEKRTVLRRLARVYLKAIEPPPARVRFDVISIYFTAGTRESILFRSAFDW